MSEAALALEMTAGLEDIALTMHPHPTLGEAMMVAANQALGKAIEIANLPRLKEVRAERLNEPAQSALQPKDQL